jgi:eukaryotic-like serine/threonine-protein kinase
MAHANSDLLFGMIALQNGMIDQSQLVAAFQAWTLEKNRPLAEHLVGRGDLEADQRLIIESIVALYLKKHAGSAEKSLAAIASPASTRQTLERIADSELATSLALLPSPTDGDGAIDRITDRTNSFAGVNLEPTDPGQEPWIANDGEPPIAGSAGRYQILGEIARGGMGAVLRGRDPVLGRDLALKVLLDQHRDRADLVDRFVEEAQICGQLQHPGVVPVFELGTLPDRRPFFAMKLVKGQTLAAILAERKSPADDLPRFLSIFEAVCQAVAYAHARGVIHRDLKPSNVMVGAFGEVQVMDWGLAKVLPRHGQPAREPRVESVNETVVSTLRTAGDSDLSEAGSVLGTPAYMAPEQARGETDVVGRRSDVFALGSILCEVLTGAPAFGGGSAIENLRAAGRGDTTAAVDRLARCEAEVELIALARECLAARPDDRPADAGVVAGRLTAYMAGVQERLRAAELARAAESARALLAEAKAAAELRARRLTRVLAATVFLAGGLGVAGWRWVELDRMGRAREATSRVELAVREATRLRGQALGASVGDLAPWDAAASAVEKARALLVAGVEPGVSKHVEQLAAEIAVDRGEAAHAAEAAARDGRLLDRLTDIRSARADDRLGDNTDAAYSQAFRDSGIDVDVLAADEAGRRINARPREIATALAMTLDDWAMVRRDLLKDATGAGRLAAAARQSDPDPWRDQLRDALEIADRPARRSRLAALAVSLDGQARPPISLDLLGKALGDVGAWAEAEAVLRRGVRAHPGDLWLNYDLARALEKLARRDDAVRYYTAARMLRPETAHELAHALKNSGESEEAIAVFRDLVRIRPGNGRHLCCLGDVLQERGRSEEARQTLTEAIAVLERTIAARPNDYFARINLGGAYLDLDRIDDAIATYREAARIKPGDAQALSGIGGALNWFGRHGEAAVSYREALRLDPDDVPSLLGMGAAVEELGRPDEAIEFYRRAMRNAPDDASTHHSLSTVLRATGRLEEAVAEAREAVRLRPDDAALLSNLGWSLANSGHFDEAEAAYRDALKNRPNSASTLNGLAWLLVSYPGHFGQNPHEAVAMARRAVELGSRFPTNVNTLGVALYRAGMLDEAVTILRRSALLNRGKDASDWFFLAMACWRRGEFGEASDYYVRGVTTLWRFPQQELDYDRFWAEAAGLFGAFGPGPVPARVKADPEGAIAELRRAVAAGTVDRRRLEENPGFTPLRSRPDFRPLLDRAVPGSPPAKKEGDGRP